LVQDHLTFLLFILLGANWQIAGATGDSRGLL